MSAITGLKWTGRPVDDGYELIRRENGIMRSFRIREELSRLNAVRDLLARFDAFQAAYANPSVLRYATTEVTVRGPLDLCLAAREWGSEGLEIQRYKGLGEMNPDQLRETTLDVNKRTLMRMSIVDAEDADRKLAVLMGDEVQPRKEYIFNNYSKAEVDI